MTVPAKGEYSGHARATRRIACCSLMAVLLVTRGNAQPALGGAESSFGLAVSPAAVAGTAFARNPLPSVVGRSSTASPRDALQGRPIVQIVTSSGLQLRSEPRYDAPRVSLLPKGGRVCVLRAVGKDWYEVTVRLRGRTLRGFVARGFTVDLPGELSDAQVQATCGKGTR